MVRYFAAAFIIALAVSCGGTTPPEVRHSVLAGTWYPADASELLDTITALIDSAPSPQFDEPPLIAVIPHAGYAYSGAVAAAGYAVLKKFTPDLIVIMGPAHHALLAGGAVHCVDYYETPLGKVRVARDLAEKLSSQPLFSKGKGVFDHEHCIEIQLPFLQSIYGSTMDGKTAVLPLLIGEVSLQQASAMAASIAAVTDKAKRPLFIVSSDFTHYGPRFGYVPFPSGADNKGRLKKLDFGALECILKKDRSCLADYIKATDITVCGRNPLLVALSLPFPMGTTSLVHYDTSCTMTKSCEDSVSYASIVIGAGSEKKTSGTGTIIIPVKDRRFLLDLARRSIAASFSKHKLSIIESAIPPSCRDKRALFVTLKSQGELRGCIGTIHAVDPLWRGVMEYACHAAFEDPRFPPLMPGELPQLSIEISVLTEPYLITSTSAIVIGRDGLIIEMNGHRGLLLPQVAVAYGWTLEEFLVHLCRKAGLPDNAWQMGAAIYAFQALVFGEDDS